MSPERWQKVKKVLDGALEHSPNSRGAFLATICADDFELRREVESLLEFEDAEADFIGDSVFEAAGDLFDSQTEDFIGQSFGNYRIVEEIGAGGMGAVFLAERIDGEFSQRVAVKIIKRDIGSDSIRRRFRRERQILAKLEHPNIARLIDGGTTGDGSPYLVMEFVEGIPINDYAAQNDLNLTERLDLFREVCAAVAYAHRNLIVHRDLKPSNILVGKDAKPKLLDFGIAKLLNDAPSGGDAPTQTFVFTPEYASPEQMRGENLTTATDIYSLGVILYELLTDRRPFVFDGKNFGDMVITVSQKEPSRPSSIVGSKFKIQSLKSENQTQSIEARAQNSKGKTANSKFKIHNPKSLRGDLDNIVLKALKRDAERRYSSVEQFSEDIGRHLKGLPVAARQDTLLYRVEKFTRRNPLVVGAVALAFFILIGGIAATGYQARKANAERAKAERRFNDVRRLANSFMFEVNEEIQKSPIKAREMLVARALEYLDKLAAEAGNDAELESELAAAYEKIGSVQAELFSPNAGKTSDALESHRKSLEIREKLFRADSQNVNRGIDAVKSRVLVGDILSMSSRVAEAAENYRQAIQANEKLLALDNKNPDTRRSLASAYSRLGQSILRSGSLGDALANYQKSLQIYQSLLAENPSNAVYQRYVSYVYSYIGYVQIELGNPAEAVRFFGDSLALTEKFTQSGDNNREAQSDLSTANLWLGVALSEAADFDKSLLYINRAIKLQAKVFEADQANFGAQNGIADCYLELGRALTKKAAKSKNGKSTIDEKEFEQAIQAFQTAIKHYENVWKADSQNTSAERQISFTRRHLAEIYRIRGDASKALQIFNESLEEFENLTAKDTNNTEWQYDLAFCHLRIGEILYERDRSQAVPHLEKSRAILVKLAAASPENVRIKSDLEKAEKYFAQR